MAIQSRFSDWNLDELEETFGLKEVFEHQILTNWIQASTSAELKDYETAFIKHVQKKAIYNVESWNEVELGEFCIGPILTLVDFTTEKFNIFSERGFKAVVGEYELSGEPDAIIAKGRRSPKLPYFCFHEYKKANEPRGDPAAQALAAMVAAQELNGHKFPVYGMYIVGANWRFMFLKDNEYGITTGLNVVKDDIFDIVKILKALKNMIIEISNLNP